MQPVVGGDEGGSPKRSARKNSAALAERFSGQLSGQRREAPAGTGPERLLRAPESDDLAPADRPEGRGGPQTPGNPRHRARAAENESRSGLISLADGLRATRNRGRSGGSGRRARGWSQARRAFPAGMKRSVQSRHFCRSGSRAGAMWGCKTLRPPRFAGNRPCVLQPAVCVSLLFFCGLSASTGRPRATKRHGVGVGSGPPRSRRFAARGRGPFCALFCRALRPLRGVAPC